MDQLIDLMKEQPEGCVGIVAVIGFTISFVCYCVMNGLVSIFRGRPEEWESPTPIKPPEIEDVQDCPHEENMTGKCLKRPQCVTTSECNAYIATIGRLAREE